VLQAREEERRRLARDLHDGLLQTLVNLSLAVDRCARLATDGAPALVGELARLREGVQAALEEGRSMLVDLRPVLPGDVGLVEAMRVHLEVLGERHRLRVGFVVSGRVRPLGPPEEVAVFRIFQEALNNVVRHAGARSVEVALAYRAHHVRLQVRDDGHGLACPLPPERLLKERKYGVLGMREQAAALGGELSIQSRPGGGTLVDLVLPVGRFAWRARPRGDEG